MDSLNHVEVRIGKVEIGRNNDILQTTLGSCVGISFLWKEKKVYGLAHCLLPESPTPSASLGAKYVDQAIESLIRLMRITENDFKKIEVHVAGGGNMFAQLNRKNTCNVGEKNAEAAKEKLKKLGIKIRKINTGGTHGRRMSIDCRNEVVTVDELGYTTGE